jgi:hypothetical protein
VREAYSRLIASRVDSRRAAAEEAARRLQLA